MVSKLFKTKQKHNVENVNYGYNYVNYVQIVNFEKVILLVVLWCNGQHFGLWIQESEFKSRQNLCCKHACSGK